MKSTGNDTRATDKAVSKLLDVLKDKETIKVLKRFGRVIDKLPEDWTVTSEFAILLDCSSSVFDSWAYLSKHPEEIKEAVLEVEDSRPL